MKLRRVLERKVAHLEAKQAILYSEERQERLVYFKQRLL